MADTFTWPQGMEQSAAGFRVLVRLRIRFHQTSNYSPRRVQETIIDYRLADQAALPSVVIALYELNLPVLSAESL